MSHAIHYSDRELILRLRFPLGVMKTALSLKSPAKVNLRLEVLNERPDGYHGIRTVFQKISVQDAIHFSLTRDPGISIATDCPELPVGQSNLIHKAAQIIWQLSGRQAGISVRLKKRIPLGAGLGGGSSNAAATLTALNELLGLGLSEREMMDLGVRIGADVPFFFLRQGAIARGVGEKLKEVVLPRLWYVLVYPNFEVPARWAYRNFKLTKKKVRIKIQELLTTPEEICKILMNDLEKVVSAKFPQIDLMKKILHSAGAMGTLMTGSGPTVFGIFPDGVAAAKGFEKTKALVGNKRWRVLKAHSLP